MKKLLIACATLSLLLIFGSQNLKAQSGQTKVATLRHINWLGAIKRNDSQRLIISKPGEKIKIIPLEQRYLDDGMNEQIHSDNQKLNNAIAQLYNEGYKLSSSTSSNFSFAESWSVFQGGNPTGGREIIYVFIKE